MLDMLSLSESPNRYLGQTKEVRRRAISLDIVLLYLNLELTKPKLQYCNITRHRLLYDLKSCNVVRVQLNYSHYMKPLR